MLKQHKTNCPINWSLPTARYALVTALSPQSLRKSRWAIAILAMVALAPSAHSEGAGIATDGSFGIPAQVVGGANMAIVDIPQNLGKVEGSNLFHSFAAFNIDQGKTVTFQENITNSLDNVFARVTGRTASEINGSLVSTPGGHANFYLINPAGVMFGSGAKIDVAGDFHVSTADEIRFQDGSIFSASAPNSSSLSAAAPTAFGFSGTTTANNSLLKIDGAQLAATAGKTIDMVGGNISLVNGASLTAEGGEIRLIASKNRAGVSFDREADGHLSLPAETPSANNAGILTIQGSTLDTSGKGGGRTGVWGGNISIGDGAVLTAINSGAVQPGPSAGVEIWGDSFLLDGGYVIVEATDNVDAGNITVASNGDLDISNQASVVNGTIGESSGRGGNIFLKAGNNLTVLSDSSINLNSESGASLGGMAIQAGGDILFQGATVTSQSYTRQGGAISVSAGKNLSLVDAASIQSYAFGPGDVGTVSLKANGNISLATGGRISTQTINAGQAGTVNLSAGGNVLIDGRLGNTGDNLASTISSASLEGSTGAAGAIHVDAAGDFTLRNGAAITTDTNGQGMAGDIRIEVGRNLVLLKGGTISGNTSAQGRGGSINARANTISLSQSSISAKADASSTGLTGQVVVSASNVLALDHASSLSVENQGSNAATAHSLGGLDVSAPVITLTSGSQITTRSTGNLLADAIAIGFNHMLRLDNANISTSAQDGDGGAISIHGSGLINLRNAQITTSVTGSANGNGGDIAMTGNVLLLRSSTITADTLAPARGGNIILNLGGIVANGDNLVVGGGQITGGDAGVPGWNLIRAAAPGGVSGLIQLATPQLNLNGTLPGLGGPQFQTTDFDLEYCNRRSSSSLNRVDNGGPPVLRGGLLDY